MVGELALQPWRRLAQRIQKGAESGSGEMRIAVEVVVSEIGVLLQRAAVALAPATVVAHKGTACELLHQRVQLAQRLAGEARREFAPQRPEQNRRVIARLPDNRLVFALHLRNLLRVHIGQPERQLQPDGNPEPIAQLKILSTRNPEARFK